MHRLNFCLVIILYYIEISKEAKMNKLEKQSKNFIKHMSFLILFSFVGLFSTKGFSQSMALEPQNRTLIGYTYNDGNMGFGLGFDSRLTQLIFINIGAFISVSDREYQVDEDDPLTWISLYNGIYAAPGFRIPHRYKSDRQATNWDVVTRTGFACVSSKNAFAKDWFLVEPATFVGVDILLKKYRYGLSLSGKAFHYRADISSIQKSLDTRRPQFSALLFYQW
jgi:hypothetical protein